MTIATATKKQTPLSIPAKLDDGAIIGKAYDPHIARRLLGYDAAAIAEMASRLWTRALTRHRSYRDFFSILFPGPLKFNEDFGLVNDSVSLMRCFAPRYRHAIKTSGYHYRSGTKQAEGYSKRGENKNAPAAFLQQVRRVLQSTFSVFVKTYPGSLLNIS